MPEVERYIQIALPSPKRILTPGVLVILLLLVAGYALVGYFPDFVAAYLAVSPRGIFSGRIWQLVTYSFAEGCPSGLVFDGLVVLFIGSAVEREWHTRRLLLLWLAVSIACAVVWVLAGLVMRANYIGLGSAAASYGLIGTFGLLFRRQRFLFWLWTVEAQHIAILLIVIGIVVGIRQPMAWIWVAGAGAAYIHFKILAGAGKTSGGFGKAAVPQQKRGFVDID